jgi:putative hydrolase of the HAD superfamily
MTARPSLEAVIFDAGGTLIRLDFEWMSADLASHGHVVGAGGLRRAEIAGRRAYDASTRPGDESLPGTPGRRGDVREYFGGALRAAGIPERAAGAAVDRFLARERDHGLWARPVEGARAALDAVAALGLRAAVVSNSDGRAERHLAAAGMLRGIEFVVDSHLVGFEKPDPRIFAVAIERLGVPPGRALFVGDIRSVDEAGAAAAGMPFVLLDPYQDYAAPGSARIDGIHELTGWIAATFSVPGARGAVREAS